MTGKLRSNQRKAIEMLLDGHSKTMSATAAGVNPGTLSRWLADPDFRAALAAETDQAVKAASARFTGSLDSAASVMTEIMQDSEDDSTRLRAADLVVSHAQKLREIVDLAERVARLEELANNGKS